MSKGFGCGGCVCVCNDIFFEVGEDYVRYSQPRFVCFYVFFVFKSALVCVSARA